MHPELASTQPLTNLRVRVFETGSLTANGTFLRGEGLSSLFRKPKAITFPVLVYLIEHPEGPILVDTGLGRRVPELRTFRGFPPMPAGSSADIGPQLRHSGVDPGEVRLVVLTHLDWDHTGGLHHFPNAEVLVHRPELEFAQTRMGRWRYRPSLWPAGFAPSIYDLHDEPFGPFPASRTLTRAGDVRLVPIPGHSPGQVGVVYTAYETTLLFAADHMLRADWFDEDLEAGRSVMLGAFGKKAARDTTRRLKAFTEESSVLLLPSHDSGAADRLANLGAVKLRDRSGPAA